MQHHVEGLGFRQSGDADVYGGMPVHVEVQHRVAHQSLFLEGKEKIERKREKKEGEERKKERKV